MASPQLRRDQIDPRWLTRPWAAALDELLAAFNRGEGGKTARDLLLWLEAERHIAPGELAALLADDEITTSRHLPARLAVLQGGAGAATIVDASVAAYPATVALGGAADMSATAHVGAATMARLLYENFDTTVVEGASTAAVAPTGALAAGEARYVILGHAGQGGMATVHVARDTELMRKVALKSLHPEVGDEVAQRARFIREVQITAQLDHPHIVPVYGLEVAADGAPAYAMKLIEGRTLGDYLHETRDFYEQGRTPDEAHDLPARLEFVLKVCDAVAYAHGKGVIHRDLKPANVMIGRHNEIYVMDWGLCRLCGGAAEPPVAPGDGQAAGGERAVLALLAAGSDPGQTREGSIMGTPRYMSPEQAQGRQSAIGPASDQCALGLLLFETITLETPFAGSTLGEVLDQAARGLLRPFRHRYERRAVAGELVAIVRKATALAPTDRYADVRHLADDLRRYLRGAEVAARPDSPWQTAARWLARHRQLALAGIVAFVALAVATELVTMRSQLASEQRIYQRELRLVALTGQLAERREELGGLLLKAEGGLQSFAAAAEEALLGGVPSADRFFRPSDLRDPRQAPPDMTTMPGFRGPMSPSVPVWTWPATLSLGAVEGRIRRVVGIRGHRATLFSHIESMLSLPTGPGGAVEGGASAGTSALVGLQLVMVDGLTSIYPGQSAIPDDFDARTRPWYQVDSDNGVRWGPPYLSALNPLVQIAVSAALLDGAGQRIGVVSLTLSADRLRRVYLQPAGIFGAVRLLLVDPAGRVLLDGADPQPLLGEGAQAPEPWPYPDPELVVAMGAHRHGYRETRHEGRRLTAAFDRLPGVDWTLLALVDDPQLLADE